MLLFQGCHRCSIYASYSLSPGLCSNVILSKAFPEHHSNLLHSTCHHQIYYIATCLFFFTIFIKCKLHDSSLFCILKHPKHVLLCMKNIMLVWLSGLSAELRTERSTVQFPVRTHAWVAGQVPSWGCARGNQLMYLSHTDVSLPPSLPSPLSKNKFKKFTYIYIYIYIYIFSYIYNFKLSGSHIKKGKKKENR